MKKIIAILFVLASLLSCKPAIITYTITNDLASSFVVFNWTNNAGNYQYSEVTNIPAGASTNYFVWTNAPTLSGLGIYQSTSSAFILVPWSQFQTQSNYISSFASTIFNAAMTQLQPPNEIIPQTQQIIKSYFITGAVPTQQNYWEFIDTIWYYIISAANSAQEAQEAAATASSISKASLTILIPANTGGSTWTTLSSWTNTVSVASSNNILSYQFKTPATSNVGGNNCYLLITFATPVTYYGIYSGQTTNNAGLVNYIATPGATIAGWSQVLSNSPNWAVFQIQCNVANNTTHGFATTFSWNFQ